MNCTFKCVSLNPEFLLILAYQDVIEEDEDAFMKRLVGISQQKVYGERIHLPKFPFNPFKPFCIKLCYKIVLVSTLFCTFWSIWCY